MSTDTKVVRIGRMMLSFEPETKPFKQLGHIPGDVGCMNCPNPFSHGATGRTNKSPTGTHV